MVILLVAASVGGNSTIRNDPLRTSASSYWRTDSHRPSGLLSSHGSRIRFVESWSRTPLKSTYCGTREGISCRWLRLLEDLDRCGRLSWGSAVLAWLYCQMCRATEHGQLILDGCVSLLLSWAYHHISMLPPDGFDTRRFPLVERFVAYRPDNARDEHRLRHYRRTLKGIGILNVEWMPYADLQLHGLVPPMIKGGNGLGGDCMPAPLLRYCRVTSGRPGGALVRGPVAHSDQAIEH
ncbi:hypothetical protein Ahy_B01g054276 isoform A [Arachis hypogaea]|uniref:Aminotransferase-like plant mobile domain-containing protein n=1 Tax=Arachis hypogaea TaxID=3818 RepID=A0A445ATL5_ARAHY|nr:hypothetical protein Ahy_B01g054276 isoform A [Arachis hypogaea]